MTEDWLTEIAAEISIESLPGEYQGVARIIGIEPTLRLGEYYGGMGLYLPKLDGILHKKRDEKIRREFNGANHRELARKYGLTERWIRAIVQARPGETSYTQSDIQLPLL